ncbi:MAG: ABC transporter ATP-binding protein [Deltaproteobacteria bacterium]|nr:ABC transporter ATP-binding protein [Deltaproteobacteria bacterium]
MKVVIENVSKKYSDRHGKELLALSDISLTLHEEEFVVLLGPSGCGKSTLLNMVAGILSSSSGRIYFDELTEDKDPRVAMVFQDAGLFPWRSVYKNIAFGLEEMKLDKNEVHQRVCEYTKMVGLAGFEKCYPHQLSGGMRQRVGIARALSIKPDLLMMDEPFSALDAQTRTLMQEELLKIWTQTRLTTLYVTHNIQEAVYLADRIVVLSRRPGKITSEIKVEISKFERDNDKHLESFNGYVDKIWHLIRKDAEDALLEV